LQVRVKIHSSTLFNYQKISKTLKIEHAVLVDRQYCIDHKKL
jgi:hypothetical protein